MRANGFFRLIPSGLPTILVALLLLLLAPHLDPGIWGQPLMAAASATLGAGIALGATANRGMRVRAITFAACGLLAGVMVVPAYRFLAGPSAIGRAWHPSWQYATEVFAFVGGLGSALLSLSFGHRCAPPPRGADTPALVAVLALAVIWAGAVSPQLTQIWSPAAPGRTVMVETKTLAVPRREGMASPFLICGDRAVRLSAVVDLTPDGHTRYGSLELFVVDVYGSTENHRLPGTLQDQPALLTDGRSAFVVSSGPTGTGDVADIQRVMAKYDPVSGKQLGCWVLPAGTDPENSPRGAILGVAGEFVLTDRACFRITGDNTLERLWEWVFGGRQFFGLTADYLLIRDFTGTREYAIAVELATGRQLWQHEVRLRSKWLYDAEEGNWLFANPVALKAIRASDGQVVWEQRLPTGRTWGPGKTDVPELVLAGGRLIVFNGWVSVFDPTAGTAIWQVDCAQGVDGPAGVTGEIFFIGHDRLAMFDGLDMAGGKLVIRWPVPGGHAAPLLFVGDRFLLLRETPAVTSILAGQVTRLR